MVRAMRFLHTSDWHLGRSLHRADLRDAQAAFLDHLIQTARTERVDAVLVAGDVYDRAVPSVDAVALCEQALVRLRKTGARVILISGNHDSARRLGFSSALIDAAGVHLRTRPDALSDPVLLNDDHGQVGIYGVPYLEPAVGLPANDCAGHGSATGTHTDASEETPGTKTPDTETAPRQPEARSHAAVLGHAVGRIRADAARRGVARTVVMAHAWVAGGAGSDSERDISVGGVGQVPVSLFDGFSYVALGHLHGQQTLAEHMRYSGSPLPYSFSEASHKKGSWLVEVGLDGKTRAERVPAPSFRRLTALRARIDDLLASREFTDYEADFLAVTLTDTARPEAAMDRLRQRFPHILTLEFKPEGVPADGRSYRARVAGHDDLTVASEFVRHVRNTPATPAEQRLLAEAFETVREEVG
jgi:DNA repair protein SbcD/Mre11